MTWYQRNNTGKSIGYYSESSTGALTYCSRCEITTGGHSLGCPFLGSQTLNQREASVRNTREPEGLTKEQETRLMNKVLGSSLANLTKEGK